MILKYKSFFPAGFAALVLCVLGACESKPGGNHAAAEAAQSGYRGPLMLGIDLLEKRGMDLLKGKRVGLITNHTSVNRRGTPTRLVLHRDSRVNLVALYTPEHGLDGKEKAAKYISNRRDPLTGLTAYSLYGPTRKPTPEMLRGVDVLMFDLQDIGSRSYTYISTMIRAMEAAGENGVHFVVLDRPNPLGGQRINGPPIESRWISFVGQVPVPYCHGMTAGEIAQMANAKGWSGRRCRLTVVPMMGWKRSMTWENTGLRWVPTSPNIPKSTSPRYYAATGIFGSLSGVDVGIGTSGPFEVAAGPGIDPDEFTRHLNSLGIPGVGFSPYRKGSFGGSKVHIDRNSPADLVGLNLVFVDAVNRRIGSRNLFVRTSAGSKEIFHKVYGSTAMEGQLRGGSPGRVIQSWQGYHANFRRDRQPYLIYP